MKLDDYEEFMLSQKCENDGKPTQPASQTGECLGTILLMIVSLLLFRFLVGG